MLSFLNRMRPEVAAALIATTGAFAGAIVSNWQNLTKSVVSAEYEGYSPTGDYEIELRYLFDISGQRAALDEIKLSMRKLVKQQYGMLISEESDLEKMMKVYDRITLEEIGPDQYVKNILPFYRQQYSIDEIQQLNRLYSTPEMRKYTSKLIQLQKKYNEEYMKESVCRVQRRFIDEMSKELKYDEGVTVMLKTMVELSCAVK